MRECIDLRLEMREAARDLWASACCRAARSDRRRNEGVRRQPIVRALGRGDVREAGDGEPTSESRTTTPSP
jgi:hypothetical protein